MGNSGIQNDGLSEENWVVCLLTGLLVMSLAAATGKLSHLSLAII